MRRALLALLFATALSPATALAVERGERIQRLEESEREFSMGVASQRRGDWQAAESHYQRALGLDEDFVEARVNLARLHVDRGDTESALLLLARAQATRADYPDAYVVRGLAELRAGRPLAAAEQLELALALSPFDLEALVNLGAAWLEAGRPHEAKKPLESALRVHPGSAEACLNLAIAEQRDGAQDRAAFWARRFLELARPDDPSAVQLRDFIRIPGAEPAPRGDGSSDVGYGLKPEPTKPERRGNET